MDTIGILDAIRFMLIDINCVWWDFDRMYRTLDENRIKEFISIKIFGTHCILRDITSTI